MPQLQPRMFLDERDGLIKVRFQSVPVTCVGLEFVDDSTNLLLTDEGRDKFENPDQVQAALSESVADAINKFLFDISRRGNVPTALGTMSICDGDCMCYEQNPVPKVWIDETPANGESYVRARLQWGDEYHSQAPLCEYLQDSDNYQDCMRKGLYVELRANRKTGVNLRPIVEALDLEKPGGWPSGFDPIWKQSARDAIDALLAKSALWAEEVADGEWRYSLPGSPIYISVFPELKTIYVQTDGGWILATYSGSSGDLEAGTLTFSVKELEAAFGADEAGMEYADTSNVFPDSLTIPYVGRGAAEIQETFSFDPTGLGSPQAHTLTPLEVPSVFTCEGALKVGSSIYTKPTGCDYDFTYTEVFPNTFQPFGCENILQLQTLGFPYKYPMGHPPFCTLVVKEHRHP